MAEPRRWTCAHCQSEQTDEHTCRECGEARFATWNIAFCERILEHIADGIGEPLEVLKAMQARPCYKKQQLSLEKVVHTMRMLSKDTRTLARQIADAHAARMTLNVVYNGDTKDHIAMLKGRQVLGDVVEHKGEVSTIVKHVYEGVPLKDEKP